MTFSNIYTREPFLKVTMCFFIIKNSNGIHYTGRIFRQNINYNFMAWLLPLHLIRRLNNGKMVEFPYHHITLDLFKMCLKHPQGYIS